MQLRNIILKAALDDWRSQPEAVPRAEGDNLLFEEQVGAHRQSFFEGQAQTTPGWSALRNSHIDYCADYVTVDQVIPHTFEAGLQPASLGEIDDDQMLVRIEALKRPMERFGFTFDRLKLALDDCDKLFLNRFVQTWNNSNLRDWRPTFAAFKDEVNDDLAQADWACRLRDRLGLGHYDCAAGDEPVALMTYSVGEVRKAATAAGLRTPFTSPTVLDCGPWPYFFPAPKGLHCGRAMPLKKSDDDDLLAELLHFRMPYEAKHIMRLGHIRTSLSTVDIKDLRNHHLLLLQLVADQPDFGEDIP